MNITQRVEGDVTVFLPEGRIDTQAATDLDQALQSAVSATSLAVRKVPSYLVHYTHCCTLLHSVIPCTG